VTVDHQVSSVSGPDHPVSLGEGRYLCGLLYLTLLEERRITTGELADHLGVSGATVTEMLKTFAERGLVTYEPYGGTELSERGERVARRILWRRCVVQQFFEETAGVELEDDEAYRISLVLPTADIERLAGHVRQPCQGQCEATDADECEDIAL
jgi:DtxR family Mn-dependent transcriptional regulator